MKKSLVISGSGGQGVMSAGIMIAQTAVDAGKCATFLPEYGPEQRGGSAKCTVVVNDTEIISPLMAKCDTLIVMNEQAYAKYEENVKDGGVLLANSCRVKDISRDDNVRVISAPVDDLALELGNPKTANIILLGILIGATGIVSREAFVDSLTAKFTDKKPGVLEMNIRALDMGVEIGAAQSK